MMKFAALLAGVLLMGGSAAHATESVGSASGAVVVPTLGFPNLTFGPLNACDPASPVQGVGGFSIQVPAAWHDLSYRLTSDIARNDLDIVWLRGPQGMACTGIAYDVGTQKGNVQTGSVPGDADWAYVILYSGANATFTFDVRAA